jgi:hypothetical protein
MNLIKLGAQMIDRMGKKSLIVLGLKPMPGEHTAENIQKEIKDLKNKYTKFNKAKICGIYLIFCLKLKNFRTTLVNGFLNNKDVVCNQGSNLEKLFGRFLLEDKIEQELDELLNEISKEIHPTNNQSSDRLMSYHKPISSTKR